jgi:two-component system phosphate regulon sensor histidine kinase PhoR
MARLVEALNIMAAQVNEKIRTVIEQKNEQQAVLESMVEGVIAVDSNEKIINLNQAAAKLIRVQSEEGLGLYIRDVIKNDDLKKLISKTLKGKEPIEGEILMRNERDHYLQVHGTVLMNASKQIIGALIVLNDVTNLRRLENVSRDFVANVSHEIRTPLTSIKGFAETLLDGAIENIDDARNFLKIVVKQANRLNAIIEDLLILATLEEHEERSDVQFEAQNLKHVLYNAVQVCRPSAINKNIHVELKCDENIKILLNKPLIEQAVINLIDNAIKYSPENSKIEINAIKNDQIIEIIVQDQGVGIAKVHLPRIFERFYRVDKARSRAIGGTGLGLAIVKHIAQVHDGHVSVESVLGEGSTFKIHLPI